LSRNADEKSIQGLAPAGEQPIGKDRQVVFSKKRYVTPSQVRPEAKKIAIHLIIHIKGKGDAAVIDSPAEPGEPLY